MERNRIYNESCVVTMDRMISEGVKVDLTVTSPPYDNLRTYNGYDFPFPDIAKRLWEVTADGGVLVWIVGDETKNGSESGTSFTQALHLLNGGGGGNSICTEPTNEDAVALKDILEGGTSIDEKMAQIHAYYYGRQLSLSFPGFLLHDTMIYEKNGPAYPANDKSNRYSSIFEYMFVFSKGKPKTANLLKDRANRWAGTTTFGKNSERKKTGEIIVRGDYQVQDFGYRTNIWRVNNGYGFSTKDEVAYQHPAIFPESLVGDHVKTWTNEGDLVYDCCGGSGTTGKVAQVLKRKWILSELSAEYCAIGNKRIAPYMNQLL